MRRHLVVANWKMHGTRASVNALLQGILNKYQDLADVDVAVLPPYVFLEQTENLLSTTAIAWGAQNLSAEASGAFTGEISAAMLLDFGCRYVLVGHSERRHLYGEDNKIVAAKFLRAAQAGLHPILCVGETLAEREKNITEEIIAAQLLAVLDAAKPDSLQRTVIAYEPVWAIGTGKNATPEQAQQVHAFIRKIVAKYDNNVAQNLQILYGGSIKAANAKMLLQMPDVDGGLVGGASLDAAEFIEIISSCKH